MPSARHGTAHSLNPHDMEQTRSRHYKTPSPPAHVCVLCHKQRYTVQMATINLWGPDDQGLPITWVQQVTWCKRCHHITATKDRDLFKRRQRAHRDYLLSTWDGETMRECVACAGSFPDVLYPYTSGGTDTKIVRRKKCPDCRDVKAYKKGGVPLIVKDNAFDTTTRWIEETSGLTWTAWRQREHEAQCTLMREMTGTPHHTVNSNQWGNERTQPQEALWRRKVQAAITQYVPSANSWRAWHCG